LKMSAMKPILIAPNTNPRSLQNLYTSNDVALDPSRTYIHPTMSLSILDSQYHLLRQARSDKQVPSLFPRDILMIRPGKKSWANETVQMPSA
jgi:hypothetical protein